MRRPLICSLFCLTFFFSNAQPFVNPYPQGYFRWPVDLRPEIVANMGELRPNHWHMGLDVRTGGHENERVYAAADGYIAFIGIRPGSFGRFIVINHPNGFSTLYGHLNDFAPQVEQWVTEQQYAGESWAQELKPGASLFPVKKGDFISYSGNTGGSQGPHVHFEIRSTSTDECLNPLLFGFDLKDNVPPTLQQVALYDRSQSIYNTGRPQAYSLSLTSDGYIIPKLPVITTKLPVIGFGLRAYDRLSGSSNQDGIYSARVWVDGNLLTGFSLDSISYDETGYYNSHVDYRNHYKGGIEYQLLNRLPNDRSGVYQMNGDGSLRLTDTLVHEVMIEVKDAYQNSSTLRFRITLDKTVFTAGTGFAGTGSAGTGSAGTATSAGTGSAGTGSAGTSTSAGTGSAGTIAPSAERLIAGREQTVSRPGFEMVLRPENLFDTVSLFYNSIHAAPGAVSGTYIVNDESVPVNQLLKVRIRPAITLSDEQKEHTLLLRSGGKSENIRKAVWEDGWATAEFSDLGTFSAYTDLIPPVLNAPGSGDTINLSSNTRLMFTPADASGIRNFRALVDGKWIRFTNDKSRTWIYRFDERVPYGVHELVVRVEDVAGNVTQKTWWFRRSAYTPPPPGQKGKTKKTAVKKSSGTKKSPSTTGTKKAVKKPVKKKG